MCVGDTCENEFKRNLCRRNTMNWVAKRTGAAAEKNDNTMADENDAEPVGFFRTPRWWCEQFVPIKHKNALEQ